MAGVAVINAPYSTTGTGYRTDEFLKGNLTAVKDAKTRDRIESETGTNGVH